MIPQSKVGTLEYVGILKETRNLWFLWFLQVSGIVLVHLVVGIDFHDEINWQLATNAT